MIGRPKITRPALFTFKPFSKKQRMLLNWWTDNSPVKDKKGIIADGAIRSGKTSCLSLSYALWAMTKFNNQNFIVCGKTIASYRRNVLNPLKNMLRGRGYKVIEHRSENRYEIINLHNLDNKNDFYIFGGKDEASQDLVQGLTAAGAYFDEVALMPESFVNQAVARCSVEGAKLWFNCNPDNPEHWFKKNWIDKKDEKRLIHLHFLMTDNLSLSKEVIDDYYRMYTGVFYKRFILGLWTAAEGLLFPQFADDPQQWYIKSLPPFLKVNIGVDIGGTKSHTACVATGIEIGYTGLTTFDEEIVKHDKGTIDVDDIVAGLIRLIQRCIAVGYYPGKVYVDNAEQVIITTIRRKLVAKGYSIKVLDSVKTESNTRILAYTLLLNTHRMKFLNCPTLKKSLSSAMYDEKSKVKDKILDDFTTDIDTFDAHYYSFSADLQKLGCAR